MGLLSVPDRLRRGTLIDTYKILSGFIDLRWDAFFDPKVFRITGGHRAAIQKPAVRLDVRKFSFASAVVDEWNSLPSSSIDCRTVNAFKNEIDKTLFIYIAFYFDRICEFTLYFYIVFIGNKLLLSPFCE